MIAPHLIQKLLVEFQAQRRLDVVEVINDYLRLVEENQKLRVEKAEATDALKTSEGEYW